MRTLHQLQLLHQNR
ncbi:hypothetical protein EO241_30915 [Escherichia coli]|nr:hypothetical protein AM464_14425 [Escherichia coli]EEU9422184.1 hypothetical protein [Escherichia coli]EEY8868371.1 hypothetical protein [Escherichia coli]EEY9634360.1 hypothetical protein [Escherichia coli]EEZ0150873.1 hypothetical protein [Escherichia coli]